MQVQEAKSLLKSSYHINWLIGLQILLRNHCWTEAWSSLVQLDVFADVDKDDIIPAYELPSTWTTDVANVIKGIRGAREALMRQALDDKLGRRGSCQATKDYAERLHKWLMKMK